MADRFPLIANSSSNQIQELASGDTLDLTGNSVTGAGIITATTFSGALSGSATGLSGTPELTVSTLTGVAGTFTGNLSIEGQLTYEDVTNVDSIGVVTARSGVHVNNNGIRLGVGATIDSSGDNTLNFFTNAEERLRITSVGRVGINNTSPNSTLDVKDSSAEIRLTSTGQNRSTLTNSASGLTISQVGAANVIFQTNANERLRITSGGNIGIGRTSPSTPLHVEGTGETNITLEGQSTGTGAFLLLKNKNVAANTSTAVQGLDASGQGISEIKFTSNGDSNNEGFITLSTRPASGSLTERLNITSLGNFIFKNSALIEHVEINTTARNGTQAVDLLDGMVHNFTTASAGTWTPNFRIGSTTSLNSVMSTGEAVSPTMIVAKGATTHFSNSIQIDGSAVTPEFLGGAPTAGGASGTFDIYSYTIIKTADATFTAFCSVSTFE